MHRGSIAIVGGGVCGLLAALHVREAGGRAVLFEATSRIGGRAKTRDVGEFRFNQGPHALYVAGAFSAALQHFAVPTPGRGPDLPKGLALWSGVSHPFPMPTAHRPQTPLEAPDADALAAFYASLIRDRDMGRGKSLEDVLAPLPDRARAVLQALVRLSTYSDAPGEIDALAALDQLRLSFAGTTYISGGWRVLADSLAEIANTAGVKLRCGERVTQLSAQENGWGLELKTGPSERFDAVILAVPPTAAASMVQASVTLAGARSRVRAVRVVCMDLALSQLPSPDVNFVLGMPASGCSRERRRRPARRPSSRPTGSTSAFSLPPPSIRRSICPRWSAQSTWACARSAMPRE